MPSTFNACYAEAYEHFMGRWSHRLALPFLDLARVGSDEELLEVGCGTGSLIAALVARASPQRVVGIDYSEIYAAAARERFAALSNVSIDIGDGLRPTLRRRQL
jgi:ubiquinone/menaquinone biosynthesis C-methylase UbiE